TFKHTQSDRLRALSTLLSRSLLQSILQLASAVGFVVLRIVRYSVRHRPDLKLGTLRTTHKGNTAHILEHKSL
ncbi:hypothetical protein, partial [Roseibacillus persicicus]|uniref:hypothetical protein n=1 Tax=Roseibacillus persicicus TaxID=454148 RepID=UPI00280EF530